MPPASGTFVVILPCVPQIASSSGLSDRFDPNDLAGTAMVMRWVNRTSAQGSMDDPNSPATPRPAGSNVDSSLQGGDSAEFILLQTIKRLQQERDSALQEKDSALAALQKERRENETLRSQNQELAKSGASTTEISEKRRIKIRAQAAKLSRLFKKKTEEPNRGRFTRVRPDQMACSAVERDAGASESIVMSTTTLAAGPGPKRGKGQPRRWGFHKKAMDAVKVIMPGAFMKRGDRLSGIVSNPKRLAAKVLVWCNYGHLSLRAVANAMADEAENVGEVYVAAVKSNGARVRTLPGDADKPLDVVGRYSEKTIADAIHAFQMAIDRQIAPKLLSADVMHASVDISTFGTYHMQALVMYAAWVVQNGIDAAGNFILAITTVLSVLPSIPVGDKIVREMVDDEGKVMATSTCRAAAMSITLAGLVGFVGHGCRSWGVDGGVEGTGAQREKERRSEPGQPTSHTSNKNGIGSYRQMCDVTREGFSQAMEQNHEILTQVMNLHAVSEEDRELVKARTAPKTLTPVQEYQSCPRELVYRERDPAYDKGHPVWTERRFKEPLMSRPSMRRDPLSCMAMVKGGAALVFDCTKHLAHTATQNSFKLILPFIRDLASVILALSNVWIHPRIVTWVSRIFSLLGSGPVSDLQGSLASSLQAIDARQYLAAQTHFGSAEGITKLVEACATRWGAICVGAVELSQRIFFVAVAVVLAFAEGTDEGRLSAAKSMWEKDGFRHKGMIRFSPKNGKLCWRLSDPAFMLGTFITAFLHKCCHGLILDATSHNKEMCAQSIGGVGSVIRRALYFLSRLMWVVLPVHDDLHKATWQDVKVAFQTAKRTGKAEDKKRLMSLIVFLMAPGAFKFKKGRNNGGGSWDMMYPLQHRGMVRGNPKTGLVMLNSSLSKSPAPGVPSPLQQCYGPFYRKAFNAWIPELTGAINKLSEMHFEDNRNFVPKGLIRTLCPGPQEFPCERRRLMINVLYILCRQTIDSVIDKFLSVLIDPHLFLACAAMTETISVVDEAGNKSQYHVATPDALANAALLQIQREELYQAYAPQLDSGETLGQFMHGPLGELERGSIYPEQLKAFRRGDNTTLKPRVTEEGFDNPARKAFQPKQGFPYESVRNNSRPRPLTAFKQLAILAYKAMAQPRTQNRAEGAFSIASAAFRAGKRNTGGRMWSAIIRKMNVKNLGMQNRIMKPDFIINYTTCLHFGRIHRKALYGLFRPDLNESEKKLEARMKNDLPKYVKEGLAFDVTHISDGAESNRVLKAPNRNGGVDQNKRHRGYEDDHRYTEIRPEAVTKRLRMSSKAGRAAKKVSNVESSIQFSQQSEAQDPVIADCADGYHDSGPSYDIDMYHDETALSCCSMESEPAESAATEAPTEPVHAADGMGPGSDIVLGRVGTEVGGSEIGRDIGRDPAAHDSDEAFIQSCLANGVDPFEADDEIDPKVLEELERSMNKLNQPLTDDDAGSDSDEEAAPPNLCEDRFPSVLKRKIGNLKREYAEALATSRSWKPNEIGEVKVLHRSKSLEPGTPIRSVVLKRSDSLRFRLMKKRCVFYLLRTPGGAELITIERIFYPPNSTVVKLKYTRVLSSSDAIGCADRADDLTELHHTSSGQEICTRRYGTKSIQRQLNARKCANMTELYHWGDVTYEARAADLLGPVYWIPLSEEEDFKAKTSSLRTQVFNDMKDVLFNTIKDLDRVDFVVIGDPFSESRLSDGNLFLGLCYLFCILMMFLLNLITG